MHTNYLKEAIVKGVMKNRFESSSPLNSLSSYEDAFPEKTFTDKANYILPVTEMLSCWHINFKYANVTCKTDIGNYGICKCDLCKYDL